MVSCCSCCSLKCISLLIAFVAVFVKVVNPALDAWIAPIPEEYQEAVTNKPPFDPTVTDLLNYTGFGFLKEELDSIPPMELGLTFILRQSFPRWFITLLAGYEEAIDLSVYDSHAVDILDARKAAEKEDVSFDKAGFTLIDMGKESSSLKEVSNWRSQEDIKKFQDELRPHLQELFPEATRILFTYNVVRGGSTFGDQPAAINAIHLDYTQNDTARVEFHEEWPTLEQSVEQKALLGMEDTDEDEMKILLGIWKPVYMKTPVCDHPLAVVDARSFTLEQEVLHPIHIDFGVVKFHNLNGAIRYSPDLKFYYYPFQTESEVLVFTQYTRDQHFATPHGSFINTNCPDDSESRISVEMRAAVFMKKESK